ncbi:MAG: PHP domain-containing protein [Candidatus Limnocylindrales bacterium]
MSSAEPIVPPGPSTVDLHAHTTRSDGILAPGDLVAQAFAAGVRTFALTDHDTLAGYRDVVAAGAVPVGMALLPGVEINALVTRDLGLVGGRAAHPGLRHGPGRRRIRGDDARAAGAPPDALRAHGRATARARPRDRLPGRGHDDRGRRRPRPTDDRPGAHRRPASPRASRMPSSA